MPIDEFGAYYYDPANPDELPDLCMTRESRYLDTENNKYGHAIKCRDVIMLDAPEILLSPNTPLLTDAQDIAGAINELFQYDPGGGDEEDWQPPKEWIPVPEPRAYELYFLIEITEVTQPNPYIRFYLCDPITGYTGYGPLTIDWGDGTVTTAAGMDEGESWGFDVTEHTYTETGQFLIKITATEQSCQLWWLICAYAGNMNFSAVLIAKLGSEIMINGDKNYGNTIFTNQYKLHYLKISGKGGLPTSSPFASCYALRKIDIDIPPTFIPYYSFNRCYMLKKFDFSAVTEISQYALYESYFRKLDLPKCVSIGNSAIAYCSQLEEVNAPICESVGYAGFEYDYTLEKVTFAENCIFGANCFRECRNLYPRPDGSTN